MTQYHCWNTLLQQGGKVYFWLTTMAVDNITETMTFDTIVLFDTIISFDMSLESESVHISFVPWLSTKQTVVTAHDVA